MGENPNSLFTISLDSLLSGYKTKINELEVDCVYGGLLITDIGDLLLRIREDLKKIRLLYLSNKYDETFDLIIDTNNTLGIIDEIVYPDLLAK